MCRWQEFENSRLKGVRRPGTTAPSFQKYYVSEYISPSFFNREVTCFLAFVVHIILTEGGNTSLAYSGLRSQNLVLDRHCFTMSYLFPI